MCHPFSSMIKGGRTHIKVSQVLDSDSHLKVYQCPSSLFSDIPIRHDSLNFIVNISDSRSLYYSAQAAQCTSITFNNRLISCQLCYL